jgi:ABC-type transporter Mla maintaining outer membrane lipid asymmetry ATPase subunit MlaF/molybdopterin-guanine dinucleotide biosynthesis protein A
MLELSAFILAGGKSTRMGRDKAFVLFEGRTLLERSLELVRSITQQVWIVGERERFSAFGSVIEDVFQGRGPLAGIHAALRASQTDLNLMLAVDVPFVKPEFLKYLVEQANASAALVTVPRSEKGFQPVCAMYRRAFADFAESSLRYGKNKIDPLFAQVSTRVIEEQEILSLGFSPEIFRNLNTPEDLEQASDGELSQKNDNRGKDDQRPQPEVRRLEPGVRVRELELKPGGQTAEPYIDFRDVSKAFGDNRVLDHVSFNVLPAETVCILGRSGVGKSVSLHHIMGFLKPDSGRVIVAGADITDYAEEQLEQIRKKVTMVFQNGALFDSLTVGENVAFPLREHKDLSEEQILEIVDGLLEMVGVKEMRDLLPSDLSTGMKRSVAIARALAARPECVLYDEPTTMVDPLMAQLLGNLIKKLKYQLHLTSVVVTHDMRLAQKLADRVVFLHEAKVIFFGPYSEMEKSTEPIVKEFLELDELKLES